MKIDVNAQLENLTTPTTHLTEDKLRSLATLINKNNLTAKYFAGRIKQLISSKTNPKIQLNIFEIIEYTTVNCGTALHNEYNNLQFL